MFQQHLSRYIRKHIFRCVHSEDSDQPAHSCSLIRIFTGHILDIQRCKISPSGEWRLIRLWRLQANLSHYCVHMLTLDLLSPDIPCLCKQCRSRSLPLQTVKIQIPAFANSVAPDQLASKEANWSGSALFAIQYVNIYQKSGWSNLIGWQLEMGVAS